MATTKQMFEILQPISILQVERQADLIVSIETKIGTILSGVGVFLPIIVAVITTSTKIHWDIWLEIGLLLFVFVFGISIFAFWTKKVFISPDILKFFYTFKNYPINEVRELALRSMSSAIEVNSKKIVFKSRLLNLSLFILGFGIAFLIYGVFTQIK
jgi:uncharacterized membrane protein YqaE (UPF0057 family)